jgi:hypothetical protein
MRLLETTRRARNERKLAGALVDPGSTNADPAMVRHERGAIPSAKWTLLDTDRRPRVCRLT